jgi:2-dehydro-3-deoxyphosphogluconate aldolase/(4S)-4-hydroxy-2-oxoglutarate aldolase
VPGAVQVISALVKSAPRMVIGAGGILDAETARRCLAVGAMFLTTDALVPEVVECAKMHDAVVFPGALTPTEVIAAWRAGSDFVKVVPCSAMGGERYIQYLKTALVDVPLIAAGGVNQQTAAEYMAAGATALGIGEALIPWDAVAGRQSNRIRELARRFLSFVETARRENGRNAGHVAAHQAPVLALKEA